MKRLWIIPPAILAMTAATAAHAHVLYVMTNRASFENPGATATVFINFGHVPPVDEFVDAKDIERYEMRTPAGKSVPLRVEGRSFQANEVKLDEEGIYQFVVSRTATVSSSIKGADGALTSQRVPKGEVKLATGETRVSTQKLQRFAKAIVTSGDVDRKAAPQLGLPLEIVMVTEPGKLVVGRPARFQVLYKGQPLPQAKVTATSLAAGVSGGTGVSEEADSQGFVALTPTEAGTWMLEVTNSVDSAGEASKDYDKETYSSSLTVGVRRD